MGGQFSQQQSIISIDDEACMEQDNGSLFLMWLKKLDLIIAKHTQEETQQELENWKGHWRSS